MNRLFNALLDRVSYRAIHIGATVFTCVFAGALAMALSSSYNWGCDIGGEEAAEWHLTPGGMVRVHSRICLTQVPPAGIALLPIHLPYESARIESAHLEGEAVPFVQDEPIPKQESDTALCLSRPRESIVGKSLEVVWSLPLTDLEKQEELYMIRLESLIPVKAFSVLTVLDEGCGYTVKWNGYEGRMFRPFFMNSGIAPFSWKGKPYYRSMGTCGWPLHPEKAGVRPE